MRRFTSSRQPKYGIVAIATSRSIILKESDLFVVVMPEPTATTPIPLSIFPPQSHGNLAGLIHLLVVTGVESSIKAFFEKGKKFAVCNIIEYNLKTSDFMT